MGSTKHMLVDTLTKIMTATLVFERLMREGLYCLTQTAAEQEVEEHRKLLRQGQRQRRGERKRQSDVEEWKQWLHNRSVRLATPQEEQRVPQIQDHLSPDALCSNEPWSNELGGEV